MSKASLFNFLVRPGEVLRGVRRLGPRGALLHGVRRTGAAFERALLGPAQLRINPMGAVCNHTCPMCWLQHLDPQEKQRQFREDREQGMQLADYVAFFDGMPAGLCEVNVVGGGEPLVHPECVEIMAEVKRRGWRGYLITNGTLLDERVAAALVAMRWDLVRVSTHAGDAATYRLVQGVDHFERLRRYLQAYDCLRRAAGLAERCALHVHHVLQRENLGTIADMYAFAEDVGADHVVFEIVFALSPEKRLSPDELAAAARELGACAAGARVSSNADHIVAQLMREHAATSAELAAAARDAALASDPPEAARAAPDRTAPRAEPAHPLVPVPDAPYRPAARCSVGFDSTFVTAKGDVLPCCFSNELMGNVRERPFRAVWQDAPYRDFRKRLINGRFAQYCIDVRCKLTSFLHD
jgi:radical SAM protein with 4Fe4S-binding SPASM domain